MAEDTTVIEAAPTAEIAAAPSEARGMDKFMADVMGAVESPEPVKEQPKPTAKPEPEKPPVAQKPAEPSKPPDKPAAPAKEDASPLRKRIEQLSGQEKERLKEIETLKNENKALSSKVITPEVQREIEDNKKQIASLREESTTLRQQLSESAYERSDEFKKQFKEPWDNALKESIANLEQYPVEAADGTTRKATSADFWKVAGAHISERAQLARSLFGDNALNVLSDIRDLERIKSGSDHAIKNHRESWEGKQKAEAEQWQGQQKQYAEQRDASRKELIERFPQFFGDDPDDPEITEALKKGFEFVDSAAERGEKMTLDERAAFAEVIRARAGAFPRLLKQLQKAQASETSLKAELAKFRKSDPGGGEELDGRTEKAKVNDDLPGGGIDALALQMEKAARGES